jgi:hypothetical protein
MQQFITSAEACALLDRILQTSQSLNRAFDEYVRKDPLSPPPQPVVAAPIPAAIVAQPALLPQPMRPVAPVLTIKLSDLMNARDEARRRRAQRQTEPSPQPQRAASAPPPAPMHRPKALPRTHQRPREVEVIYRRAPAYRVA